MEHSFWWTHLPEQINPIALSIGPIQVHWYGIMYLVAFFVVYQTVLYRIRTEGLGYKKKIIGDFILWAVLGVFIGGRIGYVLFYNLQYYLSNPLSIISPFEYSKGWHYVGIFGMSYHGALLGTLICTFIFCRKHRINFLNFSDLVVSAIPLGYTFGRLGNFINGELYGRLTSVLWGMYFPLDQTYQLRHPSQLYEAFFEGIILFTVLWSLRKKLRVPGTLFSLYLIGYGFIRFFLEFFREPDRQLGFIWGPFTMGQVLCFIMIISGLIILVIKVSKTKKKHIVVARD